ncbi:MAG: hypothetical protein WC620_08960 [Methanoregula sp.]
MFVLVIILAMISGCTQQAKPVAVTTPVTTPVTVEVTTVVTTVPPTEATTEPTLEPTLVAAITQNTTAITTIVATVAKTPMPVQTTSTKITTIHIQNNSFVPSELTVMPGTGLTWINDDVNVHAIKTTGSHHGMFN